MPIALALGAVCFATAQVQAALTVSDGAVLYGATGRDTPGSGKVDYVGVGGSNDLLGTIVSRTFGSNEFTAITTFNFTAPGDFDYPASGGGAGEGFRLTQIFTNATGFAIESLTITLSQPGEAFRETGFAPALVTVTNPTGAGGIDPTVTRIDPGAGTYTMANVYGVDGLFQVTFNFANPWLDGAEIAMHTPVFQLPTPGVSSFSIDYQLTSTPEPATLTMFGIFGLTAAGAGFVKKRRKNFAAA